MATRKKNTKKAINLNNKIMFIGGQAYQLKKLTKKELEKAAADQLGDLNPVKAGDVFSWGSRK